MTAGNPTGEEAANCLTCELIERRDRGDAPPWDSILRTEAWDVVHSFDTSLLGWLVVVARRHVESVARLEEPEAVELGRLLREVSRAVETAVGCQKTYVVQFAEARDHPHVHFHVIARMLDLPDDAIGPKIFRYLGRPEEERLSEETMNELALRLRAILTSFN